jgi:hypothetical protein
VAAGGSAELNASPPLSEASTAGETGEALLEGGDITQTLHLIAFDSEEAQNLGRLALEKHRALAALASGDDRLFARISSGGAYLDTDCGSLRCYHYGSSAVGDPVPQLLVLGGLRSRSRLPIR